MSHNQTSIFARSKQLGNFILDVKQTINSLINAKPEDFQKIAASQIELLSSFYALVLDQARQSFRWAIIAAGIGLSFFIVSVTSLLLQETTNIALISMISGALVEFIAGINFYLYNKSTSQLSDFHTRLELTQKFLLGNSMCEGLTGDFKERARMNLISVMIGGKLLSDISKETASKPDEPED